jgi:hypothetical protein
MRRLALAFIGWILAAFATAAFADPAVRLTAVDGVPQVELLGSYPQSHYTVYRADDPAGPWRAISDLDVLCLASCFATDFTAEAGHTYWYRFDLLVPPGSFRSLGPYAVTIPASLSRPIGARVVPTPSRGPAAIELYLAGAATAGSLPVEVRVLDLQGRRVRALFSGSLPRGLSRLGWDGLDDAGRRAVPGVYLVAARSPLGSSTTRLIRTR